MKYLVACLGIFGILYAQAEPTHDEGVSYGNGIQESGVSGPSLLLKRDPLRQLVQETLSDLLNLTVTSREAFTSTKGAHLKASGTKTRQVLDFTKGQYFVGKSCYDIYKVQRATRSGVYLIHPPALSQGPWKVYCDMENDGGGWTEFQLRGDVEPHENFARSWEDYKVGFGDFDREYWLGNILLWALTNSDNATRYELAVDLEDWSGNKRFARYLSFRIGSEDDKYRLYHQGSYYGNAGDSLNSHKGLPFSTFDVDNDNRDGNFMERSCARLYKGGWWYGNCHDANLNGWYLGGDHRSFGDGVNWYSWTGYHYSLKRTRMRFRPQGSGPVQVAEDTFIVSARQQRGNRLAPDEVLLKSEINTLTRP